MLQLLQNLILEYVILLYLQGKYPDGGHMNIRLPISIFSLISILSICGCSDPGTPSTGESRPDSVSPEYTATATELARLYHQVSLVKDVDDIKRLQRIYGYYVDKADWENVVDLFTEDATAEYGQLGVYTGKERIRQLLYALSGGESGLKPGQLYEHMQLQPVINVAGDGRTAWGRWRNLGMTGQYGEAASWEEGPYENRYRKENGVWKISALHWYETYTAAYSTGWARPAPGAEPAVRPLPEPDLPPSEVYESFPGVYLPPFHWQSRDVQSAVAEQLSPQLPRDRLDAEAINTRIEVLAEAVQRLEDEDAIEDLQRTFGYFVDAALWTQAASLFSDDATLEMGLDGVFTGKARILEYLQSQGQEFPQWGRLNDHMQLQPVIHVAADGSSAKGRWRMFSQTGVWQQDQFWGLGTYENDYVREDGVWKIRRLHLYDRMFTPYEDGWAKTALTTIRPQPGITPDRPPTVEYQPYPETFNPPHHFTNPVTGQEPDLFVNFVSRRSLASVEEMNKELAELARRIERLHDRHQLENLHSTYGYYLDKNQWDDLAGIFAEDGTIEIAQRGVYIGRPSIRNNLDLYGEQGVHHGNLHNHMQFQPVIHVAADGRTAKIRSRAFSTLGTFGRYGTWMGGVYENTFIKVDGTWKINTDQVFNTFFAGYEQGWARGQRRHPPGITESNPPDAPPTVVFDLFPEMTYPPFHYDNPVTGETIEIPPVQAPASGE